MAGTFVFLLVTSLMAYPFIVRGFKKNLNLFMVITMFFAGGWYPIIS